MRETVYFKDDDSRLSFLNGNYVTLTNIKKKELERIIHYRMSPIKCFGPYHQSGASEVYAGKQVRRGCDGQDKDAYGQRH